MKKKIFLIVLFALSISAIAFMFLKTQKEKDIITLTPPRPDLPNYVSGKLPVKLLFKKEDFKFPTELPSLSISKKSLDKNNVSEFTNKLGLDGSIEEFEDTKDGVKYYLRTDKYFFIATPKISLIKFGLATSEFPKTTNKKLTDSELTKIATEFQTNNGFYPGDKIKALPVSYFRKSLISEGLEKTDRENAEVFQIGFLFQSTSYEILTTYSDQPVIFIQILPDGQIYNAEILLIDTIREGISAYPLKTYEDVLASIHEAKLINLYGDYISPSDLSLRDINELAIEKIKLVYLLEKGKEDFLQPIYLLEGSAKITGSTTNTAVLYIPAYK